MPWDSTCIPAPEHGQCRFEVSARVGQEVEVCRSQRGHGAGSNTEVTVGALMLLGVANKVAAFNAPAVTKRRFQAE